jgi:hypothetical protein
MQMLGNRNGSETSGGGNGEAGGLGEQGGAHDCMPHLNPDDDILFLMSLMYSPVL